MNSAKGVTLIELVVTMTVAGILVGIAIPSFRTLVVSNRLSTAANDYVAALGEARLDAIRRNAQTQLCGSSANGTDTLGTGCGDIAGQIVVLDSDGNVVVTKASPSVRSDLNVKSVTALRYTGQGLARQAAGSGPYSGLVVDLGSDQLDDRNRRCIYMATGSSLSTCTVTNTNDDSHCPDHEPTPCQ